jgi:hypothetical protein
MLRFFLCLCVVTAGGFALAAEPAADKPPVRNVEIKYQVEIAEVPEGTKVVNLWVPVVTGNDRQTVNHKNEAALRAQ